MAVTKTVNVETTNARASTTLTDTTPTVPLPDIPQGLMVIGPQVTLHFVEGAWNKANSYDYYDVVQIDGTSYIAVQDVPANTEITNTAYWAKWNDPNQQVELMQQTISQYDARINGKAPTNHASAEGTYGIGTATQYGHLKISNTATDDPGTAASAKLASDAANGARNQALKRNFILLGDSYAAGLYGNTGAYKQCDYGWAKYAAAHHPANVSNVYTSTSNTQAGNRGFTSAVKFLDLLKTIANTVEDKAAITDIVVLGGTNETEDPETAISQFCSYCSTTFPSARVRIGAIGSGYTTNFYTWAADYAKCVKYGAEFIADTLNLYINRNLIGPDNVHLTEAGYQQTCLTVNNIIFNGGLNWVQKQVSTIDQADLSSGVTTYAAATLTSFITPNSVEVVPKMQGQANPVVFTVTTNSWNTAHHLVEKFKKYLPNCMTGNLTWLCLARVTMTDNSMYPAYAPIFYDASNDRLVAGACVNLASWSGSLTVKKIEYYMPMTPAVMDMNQIVGV